MKKPNFNISFLKLKDVDKNEDENFFIKKRIIKKKKLLKKIKYKRNKKRKYNKNILFISSITSFILIMLFFIYIFIKRNSKYNLNVKDSRKEMIKYEKFKISESRKEMTKYKEFKTSEPRKELTKYEEFKIIQKFMDINVNHILINPNETFYKSDNPKISIVISVYNGEGFIKTGLCSIQNQDFKDVEIVFIDDYSKDNSVNLIKELMQKDPRIVLYQNEENKGALYSKAKGILKSKGKYVMTLDHDDLYTQSNAFSILYEEAEKNNLDILEFSAMMGGLHIYPGQYIIGYANTPVEFQPNISKRMYCRPKGKVHRCGSIIWNFLFKTEFFQKVIKLIDDNFLNSKMIVHDDFLFYFLLTRNAYNFKLIKNIFYYHLKKPKMNEAVRFTENEKNKHRENLSCLSYLTYAEFLLKKTDDTILDKEISSYELENWFLNHECRKNKNVTNEAIKVCKLFIENKYIGEDIKKKILIFFNETNININ